VKATDAVCQQARRLLKPATAEEVIVVFSTTELPLIANNGGRVCLAIHQLSQGDMGRFRRELQQAKMDWRDTLLAADS
jgi:hypothetical protein